ncbi:MAG: response regulator transcription factor, partial [Rhodoluna sp.]
MRVLLVEDDQSVADGLLDGLSGGAFETRHVSTGAAALEALAEFSPEIVLLDLGLPDMDGTEVCRKMRTVSTVPIIVVSARDEEIDRVVALEIGADDYVVKPFGMRELIARIRAVVRRTGSSENEAPIVNERVFGNLIIDVRTQRVSLAGEDIHVTAKEFELLEYLSSDPGAVFKRSDIL